MREPNKLTNRYLNGRKLALLELLTEPKKNNKNANLLYLASPGPHVLAVDAVQVSQVPDGVIDLLGNKLDFQSIWTRPGLNIDRKLVLSKSKLYDR